MGVTAPRRLTAAVGVTSAKLLTKQPPFIKRGRASGRFAVGVRYERDWQDRISLLALGKPEVSLIHSPWIEYVDRSGRRWCQPDLLVVSERTPVVLVQEVKYQHCPEAWFQLREVYQPVLRALFPGRTIGLMEVCHWHDSAIKFPEPYDFTPDPFYVPHANRIAVHIWNAKRDKQARFGGSQDRSPEAGAGGSKEGSE